MYKFLLRPKWMAFHLLIVALVTIMLMLAYWQWDRHQQRITFNNILIERVETPTQPLEQVLVKFPDASDAEWRSVVVNGLYLQDHDFQIVNVSQGGGPGFDPVSPLLLSDGRLILINRGFIPLGGTVQQAPSGPVTVRGRLRATSAKRLGAVSDASSGVLTEVQRIDIARLQQQMPSPLVNVYLEMQSSSPADDATLSRIAEPVFDNGPHLGYVGQWILFSLCALGGWFAIVRREATGKKQLALGV